MDAISNHTGGGDERSKRKKPVMFSVRFIVGASIRCAAASMLAAVPLVSVFTRPDNPVCALAVMGNLLCSLALLLKYRKRHGY